jgi:hypothetical protein
MTFGSRRSSYDSKAEIREAWRDNLLIYTMHVTVRDCKLLGIIQLRLEITSLLAEQSSSPAVNIHLHAYLCRLLIQSQNLIRSCSGSVLQLAHFAVVSYFAVASCFAVAI